MKGKPNKKKSAGVKRHRTQGKARRDHKDTVFRMLFRDPKELLELYNCINNSSYTKPEDMEITTLENAGLCDGPDPETDPKRKSLWDETDPDPDAGICGILQWYTGSAGPGGIPVILEF